MTTGAYLFLDDERSPEDVFWLVLPQPLCGWTVVRTVEQFLTHLHEHGRPAFVSFDHDLGEPVDSDGREPNGTTAAHGLIERCLDEGWALPGWAVHSQNPVGRENLRRLLEGFERHTSDGRA